MDNDIEPILETDIITKILEKIVSNNCILLLEEPDCRKSTILHKIASCSEDCLGYKFVPCIESSDIFNNQGESAPSAFVIDDIYGRFVFSFEKFMEWKSQEKRIKQLLDDGKIKLLIICSSATFLTETVLTLSLIKDYAFILPIRHLSPNTEEEYQLTYQINEVNKIRDSNPPAFYSLFFCILRKGYFCEDLLIAEGDSVFTIFRDNVLEPLNIEITQEGFLNDLPFPMNNFIKKENGTFSIQQTSIFNALATYFGQELQPLFIRYADPEIVIHHCCLVTCPDFKVNGMFCIQVNEENEEIYFERIKNQLQLGNISEVVSVRQMELKSYQTKFVVFLKNISKDALKQICIIKCRFESKTILELLSDKTCMKLIIFLREQL